MAAAGTGAEACRSWTGAGWEMEEGWLARLAPIPSNRVLARLRLSISFWFGIIICSFRDETEEVEEAGQGAGLEDSKIRLSIGFDWKVLSGA